MLNIMCLFIMHFEVVDPEYCIIMSVILSSCYMANVFFETLVFVIMMLA